VRRLWFQRIILWVSFRYEYEEERGFFVLYLSQARLSCSRALCARERDLGSLSLSLPFDGRRWCWRWLYNVIRKVLFAERCDVHCTKWVRSCLLGECIFSQQRERERKRESLSSGASSSASWRRWWPILVCFTETRLSFFLFVLTGVCDEEHVLSLSVVEEEVCRKREESNVARFFYLRFAFSRAKRSLFLRGFKGDDDHKNKKHFLKLHGVFDYSKCSEPKNLHPRYFFSLIRSLTQYFLHTHKNTHTDAHRKHSFRWKHAGCIERKHILW